MNLFVESSHDTPLVWFELAVPGGAAADPVGQEGLHRHAALLARRGAGRRDRAQFDEALDQLGASLDISIARDALNFSGACLVRNLPAVWELLCDMFADPRMSDAEHARLLRETPQTLDELRDDDALLATRWFDVSICPGHVYARTTVGTLASVATFSVAAAREVWREVAADTLQVGFAGDITSEYAARLDAQLRARLPAHGAKPTPIGPTGMGAGPRVVLVDKPDRTQSQLRIGHPALRWGEPDCPALLVAETALGGMFSSRLMQEIRVKRGWSYGAGSALRRARGQHWFEIWMATGIEVTADAAGLTQQLFSDLVAHGLPDRELDFVRNYLIGSMPFTIQTAKQRLQLTMKDALFGLPTDYSRNISAQVADVTSATVRAAMARHYRPAALVTVAITTAAQVTGQRWQPTLGPIEVVKHDAY